MKLFTESDVVNERVSTGEYDKDLVLAQLPWQKVGLQQTASGYGNLTSSYKINFCGKLYRIYILLYSNSGSSYFTVKGRRIWVD